MYVELLVSFSLGQCNKVDMSTSRAGNVVAQPHNHHLFTLSVFLNW